MCRGPAGWEAMVLGVAGVGEDLGFGSYGEGLLIRDLLLTIWYSLLTTGYLVLAIGRWGFTMDY